MWLTDLVKTRYRWLPYNYTLAYENSAKGYPLVRPLKSAFISIKVRPLSELPANEISTYCSLANDDGDIKNVGMYEPFMRPDVL